MGLLSSNPNGRKLSHVYKNTLNSSQNTDLISKNLITMGKNLEEQNSVIISRLDDICKMLYDLTKNEINKN